MGIGFVSTDGKMSATDLADYVDTSLNDTIKRVPGVGETRLFGSGYAMRIWLDPDKIARYALMPGGIAAAVAAPNTQVSAGQKRERESLVGGKCVSGCGNLGGRRSFKKQHKANIKASSE